jgi:hypothetical protein
VFNDSWTTSVVVVRVLATDPEIPVLPDFLRSGGSGTGLTAS